MALEPSPTHRAVTVETKNWPYSGGPSRWVRIEGTFAVRVLIHEDLAELAEPIRALVDAYVNRDPMAQVDWDLLASALPS